MVKPGPDDQQTILAGDLWVVFNFAPADERYRRFLRHQRAAFLRLVESVLLYDHVDIPTQDFLVIPLLLRELGERPVLELLSSGSLRLVRVRGSLGYSGRRGLSHFWIAVGPDETKPNPYCPQDQALRIVLSHIGARPHDTGFEKLVLERTREVTAQAIFDKVRRETMADLQRSPELRNACGLSRHGQGPLPGVPFDQIRIYGGTDSDEWKGDPADLILALGAANTELWLGQHLRCMDASTASPIGQVLKAKGITQATDTQAPDAFTVLCEIADVPDLGEGVLAWQVPMGALLRLKESRDGGQFRRWFHDNCRGDAKLVGREYARLLRDIPGVDKLPARVLRFLAVTAFSTLVAANPLMGITAGAIDSFFVSQWLRGHSPKFFLGKLRTLGERQRVDG